MQRNRSGIKPRQSRYLFYEMTTIDAKKYIQTKMDVVVKETRRRKEYDIPENVPIDLVSTDIGESFKPFTLILPMCVDESYYKDPDGFMDDDDVNPIFMPELEDDDEEIIEAKLIEPVKNFLKVYRFNKYDKSMIRSTEFRSKHKISRRMAENFRNFVYPRIITVRGESGEAERVIAVMLDPVRVFHDMLVDVERPNMQFEVTIEESIQIKSGIYKHTIKWERAKKKKNSFPSITESVRLAITGETPRERNNNNNRNRNNNRSGRPNGYRKDRRRNRY